ncbi:histidine kinase [Streptomyces luomodiensis]|uniref:Histidine kinase n=1 Tax=Streptomyces luomodiensis TaxID=3026192 RepID=A0ABY9UZC7_9ACTN|nr:histidine kinase [Streptomyces sp. SCA4-21]WNE97868.1 histidine kinase [Streptomyces sp. SCA4-21]
MIRRWRGHSRLTRVELYTRWTLYMVPWIYPVVLANALTPALRHGPAPLAWAMIAVSLAQLLLTVPLLRRGLDHRLRDRPVEPWAPTVAVATVAVGLGLAVALDAGPREPGQVVPLIVLSVAPFSSAYALLVSIRRFTEVHMGLAVAVALAEAVVRPGISAPVVAVVAVALMGALCLLTVRSSVWVLAVMWELDESREAQARLAVAEERLRFGRDLHDVVGRNLALIALKGELAARLARRGRPEAEALMVEVQRIARESQAEVQDVVRGYREADLQVELAGARSVLRAARVDCRIEGDGGGVELPGTVRSALGWVVREGATNVLRHADAARCTVRLKVASRPGGDRTVVLLMENDGVPDAVGVGAGTGAGNGARSGADTGGGNGADTGAGSGSGNGAGSGSGNGAGSGSGNGLKGLRERLAPLGGTLESGPRAGGVYRLRAEVPLEGDV